MLIYNEVLKYFLRKDLWSKYHTSLDNDFLKQNLPELYKLYRVLDILHKEATGDLALVDLEAGLLTHYPGVDQSSYQGIFSELAKPSEENGKIIELLNSMKAHSEAAKLGVLALDVAQGKRTLADLQQAVESYQSQTTVVEKEVDEFVEDDLEKLLDAAYSSGGLNWRLGSLNRALGPLRIGDMGFLFARPETGKTTFLASEVTFMAEQLTGDDCILWFNNEEQGSKVKLRCYEASLGSSLDKILANKGKAIEAFKNRTGNRIKLRDDSGLSRSDVERLCKKYKPRLILFDQIDKIKGFTADRDDLQLGAIYQWARELAKSYAPVIGVCQAGGEAEGIKYLNMGHVANAKTSKQAEADWILGIGLDYHDPTFVRGFSISKNKLLGSKETDPSLRHGRWEVIIEPEIGRYRDITNGT